MVRRTREGPMCTLQQNWLPGQNTFAAHFFAGVQNWCKGGLAPTAEEKAARKAGKKKRSVRTIGGGLPGLGKR